MERIIASVIDHILSHYPKPKDAVFATAWMIGNYLRSSDVFLELDLKPIIKKHKEIIQAHIDDVLQFAVMFHNDSRPVVDVYRGVSIIMAVINSIDQEMEE